ncbi:MAG: DJ-1/PfpI family protein [Vicinamibacterales bacterium]
MSDDAARSSKRIAILVEEDFEDRELPLLLDLLRDAGLRVAVVGPVAGSEYRGKRQEATVKSDLAAGKARISDFDMVVVPGGYAPDRIRMRHAMVDLVRDCYDTGKPVVTIDRGVQLLITINALRGRTATCWPSIAIDVKNAGGRYVESAVRRRRPRHHRPQVGRRPRPHGRHRPRARRRARLIHNPPPHYGIFSSMSCPTHELFFAVSRRNAAYATVNSTPYSRMTACT